MLTVGSRGFAAGKQKVGMWEVVVESAFPRGLRPFSRPPLPWLGRKVDAKSQFNCIYPVRKLRQLIRIDR